MCRALRRALAAAGTLCVIDHSNVVIHLSLIHILMLGYYDVTKIQNRKLRHYMVRYLEIMMVVCSILAIKSGSEENMAKKKALWKN